MRAILVVALAPSLAVASIPAADGTFTACYSKDSRELRLVDASRESCRRSERTVQWNQKGPPGTSVAVVQLAPGDPSCPAGGTQLAVQGAVAYACNGAAGVNGAQGPQGPQGFMGLMGPAGPQGPMGPMGPMGIPGPMGPSGVDGLPGLQGPPGATGPQGPAGPQGPKGDTGAVGAQGPMGAIGPQGQAGPQGPQGLQGATGPVGPVGAAGPQGPAGNSVTVTPLAGGDANCPNGGAALSDGTSTSYVCSGAQPLPVLASASVMQQVDTWAGLASNTPWTLCYKATRDNVGFAFANSGAYAFHARCDNRGRSFFVAKSTLGGLFGGYTASPWGSKACVYKNEPSAFLFSITNAYKHTLISAGYAVMDCPTYGPTFGGGNDFVTNLKDTASSNLGYTYACRVGTGAACATDYTGMPGTLTLVDLEVYVAP